MVVIVLIGLLAGAVALGTRSYLIAGKQAVAKLEISRICQALDTFYTAFDRYPTNDEGIEVLAQPSEKFTAALLERSAQRPLGSPVRVRASGTRHGLRSAFFWGRWTGRRHRRGSRYLQHPAR